jgi:ribose transport system permease protein
MIAGVAFGAVLGLVNGLLVLALRLPSIIVTLGTFSMFQRLALVTNNGRAAPSIRRIRQPPISP